MKHAPPTGSTAVEVINNDEMNTTRESSLVAGPLVMIVLGGGRNIIEVTSEWQECRVAGKLVWTRGGSVSWPT